MNSLIKSPHQILSWTARLNSTLVYQRSLSNLVARKRKLSDQQQQTTTPKQQQQHSSIGNDITYNYERDIKELCHRLDLIESQCRRVKSNNCIVNSTNDSSSEEESQQKTQSDLDPMRKPSRETLILTKNHFVKHIMQFLKEPNHPNYLYTDDLIFENLYTNPQTTTVGLFNYLFQLKLIKLRIQIRYSHSRLDLLSVVINDSDSTIRIRWRISGVKRIQSFLQSFRSKSWRIKYLMRINQEWNDGYSILHVRNDGKIYKHTVQKVMPDDDKEYVDQGRMKRLNVQNLDVSPSMFSQHADTRVT